MIKDYKIVTSNNSNGLWAKVKDLMEEGWNPVGGHSVVELHRQNRFAGSQHKDTVIKLEYSQTLVK
jgi:hypothetical protein